MKRILIAILFILGGAAAGRAQQTTVTATVTDPNGTLYQFGTGFATLTCPGNQQPSVRGAPVPRTVTIAGLDGFGTFTQKFYDVNAIDQIGCGYRFSITDQTTVYSFSTALLFGVTGASVNLSAQISAYAVLLPISGQNLLSRNNIWTGTNTFNNSVFVSSLTPGNCLQAGGSGQLTTIASPCGGVSSVSAGTLAPLFNTNVATPTTTPAITFLPISQNANTFLAGPSGTAIDLVDFAISTATGTASPISISATPKQSGDFAMVFSVRDNTGNAPAFTPDVSWTASSLNSVLQEYFYKNVSGTTTASASGAIGSTSPNWAAALALFTARVGFTPTLTNQSNIISGAFSSFASQAIGFTPTAGRTLIVAIMSGQTSFNLGPVSLVSFTDSVGDVFAPVSYVINNAGQGTEIILLAATNIAGGATTFSGSLTSAACPGCGVANGIVSVFEVTNLAPVTPTFGPMTVRQIVGADLPRPTPVSVGGVFSKVAVANQFLTSVNTDGTLSQAALAAAGLPATTSNCTGNNFAQGLNAGGTPICTAVTNSQAVQVFSATTLGGDVAVSATTQTTVMTRAVTMPASGCPCRAFFSYSLYVNTASSGVGYSFWINDGSANMAGLNTGQSNATSGGLTSASFGGWSTVTYANNANVTFTLLTEGDHTYTVKAASQLAGNAPNSSFQVAISTSN